MTAQRIMDIYGVSLATAKRDMTRLEQALSVKAELSLNGAHRYERVLTHD